MSAHFAARPQRSARPGGVTASEPSDSPRVVAIGTAFPATYSQDELWDGFFAKHYGHDPTANRIWHNCGVEQRHAVVDPRVDDLRFAGTEQRMRRYVEAGLPLAVEAVAQCLAAAGLRGSDVDQLTLVSCTGYGTPGIEVGLAHELEFDPRVQRLRVGDMGCYGALPALVATADAAAARARIGVVVSLELTSLHVQPPTGDLAQVVAHGLFSDAAVAVAVLPGRDDADSGGERGDRSAVVSPSRDGFEVLDVVSRTDAEHAALMTWDVTDSGFRMGLSAKVPRVLSEHVESVTEDLLRSHGLDFGDVRGWAVHPGGPAILNVVERRLGLGPRDLDHSRAVLAEHGNCSSATVLLVLDRIRRQRELEDGDAVIAMAFGPGLTLYATLLRFSSGRGRGPASAESRPRIESPRRG